MTNSNIDEKVAQHFDSIAGIYANNYSNETTYAYFFNQRLKIVSSFLDSCDRATVLDVGCGPGMMAKHALERGFDFYGIDISGKMIDTCIEKYGQTNSTHFSVGKIQDLQFPDAFFDIVLCMGILEYLDPTELESAITKISKVLKPDGQVIISLMHKNSFYLWSRRTIAALKAKIKGRKYDLDSYDGLARTFDPQNFMSLLNSYHLNRDIETVFFSLNVLPTFLEEKLTHKSKIAIAKRLDSIIKGRFKWPYIAFVVKAKKQSQSST
ncbi:methyltransferase domain-containing protein [Tumidithrix elongata RA019]|uniref:Methyltransferase domain-containing protein n=1 Tax=Tumidithrix elongata BACA0141 TaxID=2716417 RepID=A0AAW9PUK6_9CYAN|nr:methyltransferase domain-containing protein [Tumidithrix elongata RA019]